MNDSEILETGINRKIHARDLKSLLMKWFALFLTQMTKHRYRPFKADRIMRAERMDLNEFGLEGFLLHTPGETSGSISVVLSDGSVIAGDLIGGTFPHSNRPAYAPFSSDMDQVRQSLQKILDLKPHTLYTGHSRPIDVNRHLSLLKRLAS